MEGMSATFPSGWPSGQAAVAQQGAFSQPFPGAGAGASALQIGALTVQQGLRPSIPVGLKRARTADTATSSMQDSDDEDDGNDNDSSDLMPDSDLDGMDGCGTGILGHSAGYAAHHRSGGPRSAKMPYHMSSGYREGMVTPSFSAISSSSSGNVPAIPPPQIMTSGAVATPLQPMTAWVLTCRLLPPMPAPASAATSSHAGHVSSAGGGGPWMPQQPYNRALQQQQLLSTGGGSGDCDGPRPMVAVAVLDLASGYCLHASLHSFPLPGGFTGQLTSVGAAVPVRVPSYSGGSGISTGSGSSGGAPAALPSYLASAQFLTSLANIQRDALASAAEAALATSSSSSALAGLLGPAQYAQAGSRGPSPLFGATASGAVVGTVGGNRTGVSPALVLSEADADGFTREIISIMQQQSASQAQAAGHVPAPIASATSSVSRLWADFYSRFGSLLGVHSTTSADVLLSGKGATGSAGGSAGSTGDDMMGAHASGVGHSHSSGQDSADSSSSGLMNLISGLQSGLAISLQQRTALPLPMVLGPSYGSTPSAKSYNLWELLHCSGFDGSSNQQGHHSSASSAGSASSGFASLSIQPYHYPHQQHQQQPFQPVQQMECDSFPRAASPLSPFEAAASTIAGRLGAVHLSRGSDAFPVSFASTDSRGPSPISSGGGPNPTGTAFPPPISTASGVAACVGAAGTGLIYHTQSSSHGASFHPTSSSSVAANGIHSVYAEGQNQHQQHSHVGNSSSGAGGGVSGWRAYVPPPSSEQQQHQQQSGGLLGRPPSACSSSRDGPPRPALPVTDRALASFTGQWNVRGDIPQGPPALALPGPLAQAVYSRLVPGYPCGYGNAGSSSSATSLSGTGGGGGIGDSPHARLRSYFECAGAVR